MSGDEALSATVSLEIPLVVVLTVSVMLKHVVQLFHCEPPVPKNCDRRWLLHDVLHAATVGKTLSCHDMSAN